MELIFYDMFIWMKVFFLYQYPIVLSPFSEKTILFPLSCVQCHVDYKPGVYKMGVSFWAFYSVPLIL